MLSDLSQQDAEGNGYQENRQNEQGEAEPIPLAGVETALQEISK